MQSSYVIVLANVCIGGHHTADNIQTCLQMHTLEWHVKEFQVGFGPMRKTILHDIGTSDSFHKSGRVRCAHAWPKPHTYTHMCLLWVRSRQNEEWRAYCHHGALRCGTKSYSLPKL